MTPPSGFALPLIGATGLDLSRMGLALVSNSSGRVNSVARQGPIHPQKERTPGRLPNTRPTTVRMRH